MASRRKSARPTIKIRQQQEDEDDDVHFESNTETQIIVFPTRSPLAVTGSSGQANTAATPKTTLAPATARNLCVSETFPRSEPHIAIPTDVYQDFEALKSATRLDTPELMRKLLKDYQRVSAVSQISRERRLDHVIGDIVASKSSSVLDLSRNNETSGHIDSGHDDLMVVGVNSDDDVNDDDDDDDVMEDDAKPLDLTLHRQDQSASPDSAIVEDIHTRIHVLSSPAVTPTPLGPTHDMSSHEMKVMSTLKGTGPYIINLEPGTDSCLQSGSMLAQTLTLDIPAQGFNTTSSNLLAASDALLGRDGAIINKHSTAVNFEFTNDKSKRFSDKQFKNNPLISTLPFNHKPLDLPSNLGGLPSYSEALSSVINSHKASSKQSQVTKTTNAFNAPVDVYKTDSSDYQRNSSPLFQVNPEDPDTKLIPFSLNSQHGFCGQQQSEQHNSPEQQLQNNFNSTHQLTQLSQEQQEIALKAFCSAHVPPLQMLSLVPNKQETSDSSVLNNFLKSGDASFPNFLLDPQNMNLSKTSAATSNAPSNAAMQMPAFFMTTSANGVSKMVAIPVLHTLPDGVTGLQPFAFAPHPVQPSSSSTSVTSSQFTTDMIFTTSTSLPGGNLTQSVDTPVEQSALNQASLMSPPMPSPTKPKPGRPRGKGARGQTQRIPNKDMKLLTENTLFPGVYTSILKLPWSRRSRNKTKVKTISDLKKQAQMIAQEKISEQTTDFLSGLVNSSSLDPPDSQEDNMRYTIDLSNAKQADDNIFSGALLENQQGCGDSHNEFQQSVQLQKQKDIEQQQRLHAQYHLRLQDEQRKLTKQIELSYQSCNESQITLASLVNSQDISSVKQEVICHDYTLSRSPIQALCTTSTVNADLNKRKLATSDSLSYPIGEGVSGAKKSPKRRGRPPKISALLKSIDDKVMNVMMTSQKTDQEPDNFLNISTAAATSSTTATTPTFSILKSALSNSTPAVFSTNPGEFAFEHNEDIVDGEMFLNKKTTFLTCKTTTETSSPLMPSPRSCTSLPPPTNTPDNNGESHEEETHYPESVFSNTANFDVKPRRKKVSRLLKSNENFMYATFKIKPKNGSLAPRKARRKRKDVLANTAAAAETIANLRHKKFQESLGNESSRPSSMVAWKFHEQYPCPGGDGSDKSTLDKKSVCATCGNEFPVDNDESVPQVCGSCLYGTNFAGLIEHGAKKLGDPELRAECCVTCGNMFQKHYSDTSARCDGCLRSNPSSIKSSKLFSFCDSNLPPLSCSAASLAPPSTSSALFSASPTSASAPNLSASSKEHRDTKEPPHREAFPARLNNNHHLYCSMCRMEFTKICDYLHHIRDVHESKPATPQTWDSVRSQSDVLCKLKGSKTKKSLAHKTLTCPVEECPHFFREPKDLSLHLTKKHSSFGTGQHADLSNLCPARDAVVNNPQPDQETVCQEDSLACEYTEDRPKPNVPDKSGTALQCGSQKPLQCEFCDYRCRQKNALTWHMRKHPEAASQYRRYSSVSAD